MTNLSQTSPGTESQSSVPGAALPQGSEARAALQSMLAAMVASLTSPDPPSASMADVSAPIAAPAPPPAPTPTPTLAAPPASAAPALTLQTHGPWTAGTIYQVVPLAPLTHIAEAHSEDPPLWYCITCGRFVGVTLSNSLALAAVTGISGNAMKSYKTQVLAVAAFNELLSLNLVAVIA